MTTATGWLWERLNRPFDEVQVTRALLGFDEVSARHLLARLLLESDEARRLLEVAPQLVRMLRNQQGMVVRLEPSIRGPVLWPETISHRAASGFQDDLFVCATPVRDYDVPENRALLAALHDLRRAGQVLDALPGDPPSMHQASLRAAARRAGHHAGHNRFRKVPSKRPVVRDLTKIRTGPAAVAYEPAVAVLERVARGPALHDLDPFVDRRHAAGHELLRLVLTGLERAGMEPIQLRTWRGQLFSGHLRYVPAGERGAREPGVVLLDDVAFIAGDASDSDAAAAGRRHVRHRVVRVHTSDDVSGVAAGSPAGAPRSGTGGAPAPRPTAPGPRAIA